MLWNEFGMLWTNSFGKRITSICCHSLQFACVGSLYTFTNNLELLYRKKENSKA